VTVQTQPFRQRLRADARAKRYPLFCTFEITPTCNLRCHFCYVALDPYKGPYLGTEQVKAVLDRLERAGVLWLTLTGGEIFSRRDFPEIYAYAKQKGFLVTLFTNATMVTERIATMLRDNPPFSVEVSIYGADAEHYEGTTGIPGSFARFERGVQFLMDAAVPLVMKTPISTLTQHHVPALVSWCEQRGLPYRMAMEIDLRHDGGDQPTIYRIQPRALKKLKDTITEMTGGAAPIHDECADRPDRSNELYQCNAGRVGLFVDALGQASHCVLEREPAYPMLEMEWDEVWGHIGEWVTQPLPKDAPCSGCDMRSSCSNCPARTRAFMCE
jgi:MoaA/NifB/PqqE/SkfB family radical SAM enzyme